MCQSSSLISAKWVEGTFENIFISPAFRLSKIHENCQFAKRRLILMAFQPFSSDILPGTLSWDMYRT